ncbi:hypothetical protein BKA80DRAFT_100449 [Phyllosticta citrichinensis]
MTCWWLVVVFCCDGWMDEWAKHQFGKRIHNGQRGGRLESVCVLPTVLYGDAARVNVDGGRVEGYENIDGYSGYCICFASVPTSRAKEVERWNEEQASLFHGASAFDVLRLLCTYIAPKTCVLQSLLLPLVCKFLRRLLKAFLPEMFFRFFFRAEMWKALRKKDAKRQEQAVRRASQARIPLLQDRPP